VYNHNEYSVLTQQVQCTNTRSTVYNQKYSVQIQRVQCTNTISTVYKYNEYSVQTQQVECIQWLRWAISTLPGWPTSLVTDPSSFAIRSVFVPLSSDLWSAEIRIGPLHFQAGGRRQWPNLALFFWGGGFIWFCSIFCYVCFQVGRLFLHLHRSCYHNISWLARAISMKLTMNIH